MNAGREDGAAVTEQPRDLKTSTGDGVSDAVTAACGARWRRERSGERGSPQNLYKCLLTHHAAHATLT